MTTSVSPLISAAIRLLEQLISTPSFSREEGATADLIASFLAKHATTPQRQGHNVWLQNQHFDEDKPTILLNSHHDTVRPAKSWQRDPFQPTWEGDILYGLGSNDAGGPLVSLITTFLHLYERRNLPFNLVMAATAEEEISGPNGIASILDVLPPLAGGIIGEPTSLDIAVAERGLVVVDGLALGQSGHAAREEGVNALYLALEDIDRLRKYRFPKNSSLLGPVKVSVTQINAGKQHNVVPDRCSFIIDVRVNEQYTNTEVVEALQDLCIASTLTPRSLRLRSSGIAADHPLALAAATVGLHPYGSPTLSDQALLPIPTIKLGPGNSARSHTADEYIKRSEIEAGVQIYLSLLDFLYKA